MLKILSTAVMFACSLSTVHAGAYKDQRTREAVKVVDAKTLKSMIDTKKEITLVDARPTEYFDGKLIVGAQQVPVDASQETVGKMLPQKDAFIVVYCASVTCPASRNMAKRLIDGGYTNVNEYSGGIAEWTKLGYPTQTVKG